MKRCYIALVLSVFLVACGTPTSITTESSQPVSRAAIENILIVDGDLPAGFAEGQFLDNPGLFGLTEGAEVKGAQIIERDGEESGRVAIYIYPDPTSSSKKYAAYTADASPSFNVPQPLEVTFVGDLARFAFGPYYNGSKIIYYDELIYTKCEALVVIQMRGSVLSRIQDFAKRLEGRLIPLVCQNN